MTFLLLSLLSLLRRALREAGYSGSIILYCTNLVSRQATTSRRALNVKFFLFAINENENETENEPDYRQFTTVLVRSITFQ